MALRQARGLARTGASVLIIGQGALAPEDEGGRLTLIDAGVGKTTASSRRLAYFFKVGAFATMAGIRAAGVLRRAPDIEVVHCHHSTTVLMLRALGLRRPLVYTVHDNPYLITDSFSSVGERSFRFAVNGLLDDLAARRADHVVAVSPEIVARLERWGVPHRKISEIWPTAASRQSDAVTQARGAHSSSLVPEQPFLLCVGDFTGRKRMDLLVRALAELPGDLRLVIVGRGPQAGNLARLITELNLTDRITVHPYLENSSLVQLQLAAQAAVLVSEREGLPTSLIESVRAGTPALYVTTESLTLPRTDPYLRHVVSLSPTAIASAILQTLAISRQGSSTREDVRQWATQVFPDEDASARTLLEVYGRLTEKGKAPSR